MSLNAQCRKWGFSAMLLASLVWLEPAASMRAARAQDAGSGDAKENQDGGDGAAGGRRGRFRGRAMVGMATAQFSGKKVTISFGKAPVSGDAYKQIAKAEKGAVVKFLQYAAIKLRTETDLKFGNTVIKTGNISKDYPGIYSLWLKKAEDGWHLVFNKEGDIWGTQHDKAADVAEIPLTPGKLTEESSELKIEIKADGNNGVLRITWGMDEWTAKFEAS
jgi:hypothetical protein